MNEAQTRFNKIDPKLRDAGWGIVPGSKILVEQSAYIAPGRITTTGNKNPKKADYILEYMPGLCPFYIWVHFSTSPASSPLDECQMS